MFAAIGCLCERNLDVAIVAWLFDMKHVFNLDVCVDISLSTCFQPALVEWVVGPVRIRVGPLN